VGFGAYWRAVIPRKLSASLLILLAALSPWSLSAQETSRDPFAAADAVIERAITDHEIPGAVLVVGHAGAVAHRKAFGLRALEPRSEPMTPDTIFDLASLTKPFTAICVMRLVESGQVRLNELNVLRAECLNAHWFGDLAEARQRIEAWRVECKASRPHVAL